MKHQTQGAPEATTALEGRLSTGQPTDQYEGQGGTYTFDQNTGLRTLVSRTEPCEDCRK